MKKITKVSSVQAVSSKEIKGINMGAGVIQPRKTMITERSQSKRKLVFCDAVSSKAIKGMNVGSGMIHPRKTMAAKVLSGKVFTVRDVEKISSQKIAGKNMGSGTIHPRKTMLTD